MNNFEAFLRFLEENSLAAVKEKISNKTWEYVVGLDDREDWEELGASHTDAKSIVSFLKRQTGNDFVTWALGT